MICIYVKNQLSIKFKEKFIFKNLYGFIKIDK